MADLVYFTGPMDCGKSTLALQLDYTHSVGGLKGRLFTSQDRAGAATISSRLGLARPAVEVDPSTPPPRSTSWPGSWTSCRSTCSRSASSPTSRPGWFPGAQRLVELCDKFEVLQVRALCWCGNRATHNVRTIDAVMVTQGDQVVVGDTAAAGELPRGPRLRGALPDAPPAPADPGGGPGDPARAAAVRPAGGGGR